MTDDIDEAERTTFGEQLLGMEGYSAARAERYRKELDQLLIHRIPQHDRCVLAITGILVGAPLVVGGISIATALAHRVTSSEEFATAGWLLAASFLLTGALLGGWMQYVAIKGSYERGVGDWIGQLVSIVFAGGSALAVFWLAFGLTDEVIRAKLLLSGGALVVLALGCLLVALLQRMHRQTQERLLRIDYHLAEFIARESSRQKGG